MGDQIKSKQSMISFLENLEKGLFLRKNKYMERERFAQQVQLRSYNPRDNKDYNAFKTLLVEDKLFVPEIDTPQNWARHLSYFPDSIVLGTFDNTIVVG